MTGTHVFNVEITRVNARDVLWQRVVNCSLCGEVYKAEDDGRSPRPQAIDSWMEQHYGDCPENAS